MAACRGILLGLLSKTLFKAWSLPGAVFSSGPGVQAVSGWGVETRQLWGESGGTVISGILGSEVTAQKRDLERL